MSDEAFYNSVSGDRIASRQIDELIGLARGLCADGVLNQAEVQFLQKWLAANLAICDQPLIHTLWGRVDVVLSDGLLDTEEHADLFEALASLGTVDIELGEVLKPASLPLCDPMPDIDFLGRQYAFTGTFSYGKRKDCEQAIELLGGSCGTVGKKTDVLVIGAYATDSWKHSSMGAKILKASALRDEGIPISIISEAHWVKYL